MDMSERLRVDPENGEGVSSRPGWSANSWRLMRSQKSTVHRDQRLCEPFWGRGSGR